MISLAAIAAMYIKMTPSLLLITINLMSLMYHGTPDDNR